jgi:hypothetical protein
MIVILSALAPTDIADWVAITILALASTEWVVAGFAIDLFRPGNWILFAIVPLVSLLASLSNGSEREREELAFVAYGSRRGHIHFRYFLKGSVISVIGILPILTAQVLLSNVVNGLLIAVAASVIAGFFYAIPSFRRLGSVHFVGRYKR